MEIIYFLIPVSLLFLAAGIWVFFWAVKHEQFDDLEGPAHRILMDDREERRKLDDDRH
ncbi:MAG TPA: cbb3-type cytochrome oxidase assembly protein CcoS [Moraxellaceae bacterium]|nr:cbb3-type cytochrome oxidase assembly protein CcoS [Moraxellaceae bacterium]